MPISVDDDTRISAPEGAVIPAALSLDRWYRARVGGRVGGRGAQNKDSYQPPQSLVTSQNFGRLVRVIVKAGWYKALY